MTRVADDLPTPSMQRPRRRSAGSVALAVIGCGALLLGACGGDDDDASASTTTEPESAVTTTTRATTTTAAPTTTTTLPPLELVTEGATIVVANASGINGAAGRMTDALGVVGFSTGDATNSSESQLNTTKIYYDPANADAQPVAESLREALGGGDIELLELTVPAPTETGEIGDASILMAMGNDTADKSLDELQGRVPPTDTTDDEATDEATGDEATTDEATADEATDEATADEATTDG